jgi:hypothetical protein
MRQDNRVRRGQDPGLVSLRKGARAAIAVTAAVAAATFLDVDGLRAATDADAERTGAVFNGFLLDRGSMTSPVEVWADLLTGGKCMVLVGEILHNMASEATSSVSQPKSWLPFTEVGRTARSPRWS